MRLASPEKVVTALGVAANPGSSGNAGRALDLTFPIIESFLETKFFSGSNIDYFSPATYGRVFRLSCMLVDPDSLVVRSSPTTDPLVTEEDGDLVPVTDYFLDADKGLITFRQALVAGEHTLSATYDYGLGKDEDGLLKKVPYWLEEIGVAAAILAMNTTPSVPAQRKEKTVTNATKAISSLVHSLVAPKFRPRMAVEFPVRSVDRG